MKKRDYPSQKYPAAKLNGKGKRMKDEAVVRYWNDQRVVPRRVDGKMTYVIISGPFPPDEFGGIFSRMRHQELFPTEVRRSHDTVDSRLQRYTDTSRNSDTTSHNKTASISGSECQGNECGDQDQGSRISHVNDSNIVEGSSVTYEEHQIFIAENPSTACDSVGTCTGSSSASYGHASPIHEHSLAEVRQRRIRGAHRLEASTEPIYSDTVITHITNVTFLWLHFGRHSCNVRSSRPLPAADIHNVHPGRRDDVRYNWRPTWGQYER